MFCCCVLHFRATVLYSPAKAASLMSSFLCGSYCLPFTCISVYTPACLPVFLSPANIPFLFQLGLPSGCYGNPPLCTPHLSSSRLTDRDRQTDMLKAGVYHHHHHYHRHEDITMETHVCMSPWVLGSTASPGRRRSG